MLERLPQDRARFNFSCRFINYQVLRVNVKRWRRCSEVKDAKATSAWNELGENDF